MLPSLNSRKYQTEREEKFEPVYLPVFYEGKFYVVSQEDVRRVKEIRYLTINRINEKGELEPLLTDDDALSILTKAADNQNNSPTSSLVELKDRLMFLFSKYLGSWFNKLPTSSKAFLPRNECRTLLEGSLYWPRLPDIAPWSTISFYNQMCGETPQVKDEPNIHLNIHFSCCECGKVNRESVNCGVEKMEED